MEEGWECVKHRSEHKLTAETALKQTIHLNHKYALDGCDPSSYGGILWCFGQFDGPKGTVTVFFDFHLDLVN